MSLSAPRTLLKASSHSLLCSAEGAAKHKIRPVLHRTSNLFFLSDDESGGGWWNTFDEVVN